jgi:hypothetical protein
MSIARTSVGIMGCMRSAGVGLGMRVMGRGVRGLVLVGGFRGKVVEKEGEDGMWGPGVVLGGNFCACYQKIV